MRAVNLMPRDERGARFDLGRLPLFAAAGGVVVVTAAAFFVASSASSSADAHRAELQAVEASIAAIPSGRGDTAVSVGGIAEERSNRVAALAAALVRRTTFDRVLREISYVFPDDAWLTSFEAAAPSDVAVPVPGAAPAGEASTGGGVTIQGATYSHDSVATVLARLAVVPSLTDVRLTSSALVEPQAEEGTGSGGNARTARPRKQRPFVTFVVSASVRARETS
jgi:Fimbrial assembly protein (PilN)